MLEAALLLNTVDQISGYCCDPKNHCRLPSNGYSIRQTHCIRALVGSMEVHSLHFEEQ